MGLASREDQQKPGGSVVCCSTAKLCLTLRSQGLQQVRLPCPSASPGVCSGACLLCCDAIHPFHSSLAPFLLLPSMLKLKLQYFGHLMRRGDSLGKTLMLGKAEEAVRRLRFWYYCLRSLPVVYKGCLCP